MLHAFLLYPFLLQAEASSFQQRHWGMEDGLPQSTVTSMAQSPLGMMVMGTFGGLARFDGISFEVWDGSVGDLASIRVTAVDVAGDGSIWFGTQDGTIYEVDRQGRVHPLDAPALGVVWDVTASEGVVWWCTDAGVYRQDADGLSLVGEDAGWRIASQGDRVAWIAQDVVYVHEGGRTREVHRGVDLLDVAWRGDVLLVGGRQGLVTIDADGVVSPSGVRPVESIAVGQDDVWLAYSLDVWSLAGDATSSVPRPVRSLAVDQEGAVWVGTVGGGLFQLREQAFEPVDLDSSVKVLPVDDGYVTSSCHQPTGRSTVMRHREGVDELLLASDTCVQSLAEVDGRVWMGLGETLAVVPEGEPLTSTGLEGEVLAIDSQGAWVGTSLGLFRRGPDRWVKEPDIPGPVAAVVRDGAIVWVGAADGVYRHAGGTWTAWNRASGLTTTPVRDVWPVGEGAWAGTYGSGLLYLADGAAPKRVTKLDGLAENVVSRVLPDARGCVWLLGNRGVSQVPLEDLEAFRRGELPDVRARLYLAGEGSGGSQPSGALLGDSVVMPLVGGLVRVDLDSLTRNEVAPTVVVRKAVSLGADLLTGATVEEQDALRVAYTLGSLAEPSLARFRYQLDGGPWVEVGGERELSWQTLPAGAHVLRVAGENEDGVESAFPAVVTFTVPAAWHERWSVRGLIALAFVGMGFLIRRSRTVKAEGAARRLQTLVSQREKAEALAHQRGAHYRRLFEAVGDGLLLCDGSGIVVEANTVAKDLFRSELVGSSLTELLGTLDEEGITRSLRPNGTSFPAAVSRFELQGGNTLITVRDVTSEQRVSEAQRLEAVGRLAGGVAHDVNNLLTALAGVGVVLREQLEEMGAPADSVELIDDLDQCVERGGTLTRELMAFGRRQMLTPRRQSAQDVLRRVAPLLRRAATDGTTVSVHVSGEPLYVTVDAAQLELAVLNLVLNGVAALEPGGRVRVHLLPLGEDRVCIEVSDDGCGIPADVLPHIYEPFFTTRRSGTGLGLPSVHGFVAQSHGSLECQTEEGVGTTFRILLPRTSAPAPAPPETPSDPSMPHLTRVLVCDDDPNVLDALIRMLEAGHYQVTAVGDARDALGLDPHRFDLLVTDVSMPTLRGPELAHALREKRPDLPVVYVSGFTEDIDLSLAPAPLLHKPFRVDALLKAVSAALELSAEGSLRRH